MNRFKILIAALIFSSGAMLCYADFEDDVKTAEKLMEDKHWDQAAAKLKLVYNKAKKDDKEAGIAAVLLAKAYCGCNQYKEAAAVLEKLNSAKPADYNLVMGETQFGLGNFEKALNLSKSYDNKSPDLLYLKALMLKGKSFFELKKYRECKEASNIVVNYKPKEAGPDALADFKNTKENKELIAELKRQALTLGKKAQEVFDVQEYGRDYAWYRMARESQAEGKYDDAIKHYHSIKSGTLRDAARCYSATCLAEKGKIKEALKAYEEVYEGKPNLYKGEALYNAAVLIYQEGSNKKAVKDSQKLIDNLSEWLASLEKNENTDLKLEEINDALKKDIIGETPKELVRADDCGNLIRSRIYPSSITNPLTSPWYTADLATKNKLFSGFLLGELDENNKAEEAYKEAPQVSQRFKIISEPAMVTAALIGGLNEGSYILPQKVIKTVSTENRNYLNLAFFYYACSEKATSEKMFRRLLADPKFLKGQKPDIEVTQLGLSYCLIASRDWNAAEEKLEKLKSSKDQLISGRATFLQACVLAPQKGKKGDKAYMLFEEVAKDRRNGDIAPKALMAMASCAINKGEKDKALKACRDLRARYANSPYSTAALTLIKALNNSSGSKDILSEVETETGKVVKHARTIVMPGTANWQPELSEFTAGDLIVYKIKVIGRDNCTIVKNVSMVVSEEEPQPPTSVGDEIVFVRTPVLFMKTLCANPVKKENAPSDKKEPVN